MQLKQLTGRDDLYCNAYKLQTEFPYSYIMAGSLKCAATFNFCEFTFYTVHQGNNTSDYIGVLAVCGDPNQYQCLMFSTETKEKELVEALKTVFKCDKPKCFYGIFNFQRLILHRTFVGQQPTETDGWLLILKHINKLPEIDQKTVSLIKDLQPQDATIIAKMQKGEHNKEAELKRTIANGVGYGIFHGDQLLSWIMLTKYGTMGKLFTFPEVRGHGYGSSVANKLSRHLLRLDITPMVFVEENNFQSLRLFTKLGFEKIDRISWIAYNS